MLKFHQPPLIAYSWELGGTDEEPRIQTIKGMPIEPDTSRIDLKSTDPLAMMMANQDAFDWRALAMSMWMTTILEDGASTDHLIPTEDERFGAGYAVAKHVEHLDHVCRERGLTLLSRFITVGDDGDPWFDPAEGLACVRGLLTWVASAGSSDQRRMAADTVWGQIGALPIEHYQAYGPVVAAGIAADLSTFEVILDHAATRGVRFQFYLSC